MQRTIILGLVLAALLSGATAGEAATAPRVEIKTSHGSFVLELDSEKAPGTVANFLAYVKSGFYDGTVFHRVIDGFMVQGGGFDQEYRKKDTRPPIQNEADNGLRNARGTVAMARTGDPHSATAQFFVNTVDNPALDHRSRDPRGWGYTVFGRVVEGMQTVDSISGVRTGYMRGMRDVPLVPVVIESASVVEAQVEEPAAD